MDKPIIHDGKTIGFFIEGKQNYAYRSVSGKPKRNALTFKVDSYESACEKLISSRENFLKSVLVY